VVGELERLAVRSPDREADALLLGRWPFVPLRGEVRAAALPLENGRLPTVRGRVDGVDLSLILDTGSDGILLSGSAARKAKLYLPPGEEAQAISPGFDARYRRGVFGELQLGPLHFGRGVASVPMKESRAFGPASAYGIVGCAVLGRFRVTFDFKRREVRLEEHGGESARGVLLTNVVLSGRSYWLLVDSGAARLFLEPWAALELELISERDARRHEGKEAALGRSRVTRVVLPTVEVAGRTFTDVRAGVVNTFGGAGGEEGIRPAGLLGLAGFGELVWTVDFGARLIYIEE
jgi:hypothetical protein